MRAIKLLLYHGANPYQKIHGGESALEIATKNNDEQIIKLLSNAQKNLVNNLHALLSRGQTPFPSEVALKIAKERYNYEK